MKLDMISIYQAVMLPNAQGKLINCQTVSDDIVPGVRLSLHEHVVTISHDDWLNDVYVFTANIRYAVKRKDVAVTFSEASKKILDRSVDKINQMGISTEGARKKKRAKE